MGDLLEISRKNTPLERPVVLIRSILLLMKVAILIFSIGVFFLAGCSKNEDNFGQYYEQTFMDSTSAIVLGDSVHILLTQVRQNLKVNAAVPYEIKEDSTLHDTVKLNLDVLFGSYVPTPAPWKQDSVRNDTLFVWYAHAQPLYGYPKSTGTNTIMQIETSPLPIYYSVQKVIVKKSPNKYVTFSSTLYH